MNILITSAGRRVSLIRSFQKELKKLFPEGRVLAADARPEMSAGCQVADSYFKLPYLTDPDYLRYLKKLCQDEKIAMIIPTIDAELLYLSQHSSDLMNLGTKVVISSPGFIRICRDKRKTQQFFSSNKIPVAREYSKKEYKLPLFIKPIDGSRSVNTFVIKKEDELRDFHFTNDKLMFLEYLDHEYFDEFTCDMYYDRDHQLRCIVPRKRLEVRDGEVSKGVTISNDLIPFLKDRLGHIEGAVGCLTAQFFVHAEDQSIYGIEINPRFGGGYPLSYLAGANFSKWLIEEYLLDKPIPDQFDSWEKDLLMIRYDDEILIHGYQG